MSLFSSRSSGLSRLSLAAVAAAPLLSADSARAELIVGLTIQNNLISFDSATPASITTIGSVTGLTAGDTIVGIDRRPQGSPAQALPGPNNGLLYAVGHNAATGVARVYTLNESNAAATLVSTLAADPADTTAPFPFSTVSGTAFGIDFNPTVDRLRVVGGTGQNLRINVDNGLTQLDVPLAYQPADANVGDVPLVTAVAYSNNFGNATSTVLRGIDIGQGPDLLVVHANPNGGLLQTSLTLPFDGTGLLGYDISGVTGTPYFSVNSTGGVSSAFYANLTLSGTIGGGVPLVDIAAPVGAPVPEPATLSLLAFSGGALLLRRRRRR